jgi:GTPase SAR1 family protein
MDKDNLITLLLRQLRSKFVSSYFINGTPGSGKTSLLIKFASELPDYVSNIQTLGPYSASKENVISRINSDLYEYGYLDATPQDDTSIDWYGNWVWLRDNLKVSKGQTFLVLIRLGDENYSAYEELRAWFSSIRYMEHYWSNQNVRLLIVVAGYWDHIGLEEYYKNIQLSFPYTVSTNYCIWKRISLDDTIALSQKTFIEPEISKWLGKLLHEITDGYAGAIVDILNNLDPNDPTTRNLFSAVKRAAQSGYYGEALVHSWLSLPDNAILLVKELLLFKQLPDEKRNKFELLEVAGIIDYRDVFGQYFAHIRSWYIELVLVSKAKILGIDGDDWNKIQFEELAPSLLTINLEAYRIINDVENLIRNFMVVRLNEQSDGEDHILQGKVLKRIKSYQSNEDDDLFIRAENWRLRNQQAGIEIGINPLIAHTSTGDLIRLVQESAVFGDPLWKDILDTVEKLAPIRDAVMHNQIIDEKSLKSLYMLQAKIYKALKC